MNIDFKLLSVSQFPLLLKWLEAPHIKQWWDQDLSHTEESIAEKYTSYVNSNKIRAYIISIDDKPIGYIQIYNAYDFAKKAPLIDLPKSLAAIDFFIGDADYIGKGVGVKVLKVFDYQGYKNILVDPDMDNIAAIKTYKKAGFKRIREQIDSNEIWMLKENG